MSKTCFICRNEIRGSQGWDSKVAGFAYGLQIVTDTLTVYVHTECIRFYRSGETLMLTKDRLEVKG